jgi:AraC-like DNA-binding protein
MTRKSPLPFESDCAAEVAIGVGFSDQSQLCFHFKRIVGLTPGRFRASAKST